MSDLKANSYLSLEASSDVEYLQALFRCPFPGISDCGCTLTVDEERKWWKEKGLRNDLNLALDQCPPSEWVLGFHIPLRGLLWGRRMIWELMSPLGPTLKAHEMGRLSRGPIMKSQCQGWMLSWLISRNYGPFLKLSSFWIEGRKCWSISDFGLKFWYRRLLDLTRKPVIIFLNGERTKHWQQLTQRLAQNEVTQTDSVQSIPPHSGPHICGP